MRSERIEELKQQIAELESRWPAHSVPPAMLEQLDHLEDELANELTRPSVEQVDEEATGNGKV
jgi:hypothetical protein